jgi:hypothetical protein
MENNFNVGKYERNGFNGIDQDLFISLNEYGLIWKVYKKANKKRGFVKGEYLFIFIDNNNELNWSGNIHIDTNLKEHFSWVNWKDIFSFTGIEKEEYFQLPNHIIITDLISYYGTINIFGA